MKEKNIEQLLVRFTYDSRNFIICDVYFPLYSPSALYESHLVSIAVSILIYSHLTIVFCGDFISPDIEWSYDDYGFMYSSLFPLYFL